MSDNSKVIQDWQDKLKHSFDDEGKLHDYLFKTLDNFLYRYLETSEDKNLLTAELGPYLYGAESFESSMVEALKMTNPKAKPGIMELAKSVPKAQKPKVKYSLKVQVKDLQPEHGELIITGEISWDFPQFNDPSKALQKIVLFKYSDLGQFRKELALKLEEACELFS